MASELEVVRDATAAVIVSGQRKGSAGLGDGRHLLTAKHVLRSMLQGEQALVYFPSGPAAGTDLPAARLALPEIASADVAVLDLGEEPGVKLPRSVRIWPARRLPQQVSVLG